MFRKNTAAFVHDLPATSLGTWIGDSTYVRVQVLTNARRCSTARSRSPWSASSPNSSPRRPATWSLTERTWVLLTEAPEGGWGLRGHAHTNEELVAAAARDGRAGC